MEWIFFIIHFVNQNASRDILLLCTHISAIVDTLVLFNKKD